MQICIFGVILYNDKFFTFGFCVGVAFFFYFCLQGKSNVLFLYRACELRKNVFFIFFWTKVPFLFDQFHPVARTRGFFVCEGAGVDWSILLDDCVETGVCTVFFPFFKNCLGLTFSFLFYRFDFFCLLGRRVTIRPYMPLLSAFQAPRLPPLYFNFEDHVLAH